MSGAASGDPEIVRLLLDAGSNPDDFPKSNDPRAAAIAAGFRTPLMWAAYRNDERMVRLLLDRGADPNRSTFFGNPLLQACWNDSFEAAALLIDRGADVHARDAVGFTALHRGGGETSRSVRTWSSCCWAAGPTRTRRAGNPWAPWAWCRRPRG